MNDFKTLAKLTNYARKEIKDDDIKNSAYFRWLNKKVEAEEYIFKMNEDNLNKISRPASGSLEISNAHYDKCLLLSSNIDVENTRPRPSAGIVIDLSEKDKGIDITKFNRVRFNIYLEAVGIQNVYFHFFIGNDNVKDIHTLSVYANTDNKVMWEIDDFDRDNVKKMVITPFLFGCPSEALGKIKIYISDIKVEKVKKDYDLGFDLEDRIAYSHVGYFTKAKKIALVSILNKKEFNIVDENDNIVFTADASDASSDLGKFYSLDFSNFKKKGRYAIKWDNNKTPYFEISDNPYLVSELKSMNFLRSLRCGEDIPGVHSACHLNCRTVDKEGNSVPNFGGWHDAGDLSQFEIPTAEMTHALVDLAFATNDEALKERIKEEAKVGGDWLLRTSFHNGERALAITYKLWRDNLLMFDNKDVFASVAENGPFENFLSAAALASLARLYKEDYPIYSDWCLRTAIEDFNYGVDGYKEGIHTKRWGSNIDSVVCGHAITAACEIYKMNNDNSFLDNEKKYAKVVLKCQQSTYPDWDMPIRGFFYEDPKHKYMLTYEHRGHEQSPIQGLCNLYKMLPNDPDSRKWLKGIKLYKEYILSTLFATQPYGMLPGHVYDINKLNMERFTSGGWVKDSVEGLAYLQKEASTGIKLADGVYLRRFPIAIQRRGFHATLLSKTKGLSEVAKILNDKKLMQIAIDQLEWILGKNPFASSTMYGEGHNYHPLYVAYSRQMVGSLPVGIMTNGDLDLPYWPTYDNAVFKEIWGHTTGKYLWVLADILKMYK